MLPNILYVEKFEFDNSFNLGVYGYGNENGYEGYTKLFIYPGYKFKAVDRLITNFHLPQSSLLMLVSAFIGYENMKSGFLESPPFQKYSICWVICALC